MRKGILAGGMLFLGLVVALPAQAKGPGDAVVTSTATVSGPGIRTPLVVTDRNDNGPRGLPLIDRIGVFSSPGFARRPEGPLGARYSLVVGVVCPGEAGREASSVLYLDLYPFARFGSWLFSREGQAGCFESDVAAGWHPAGSRFMEALWTAGFPRVASVPVSVPGSRALPAAGPSRAWVIVAVCVALAGMVAAGALAGRRRGAAPVAG